MKKTPLGFIALLIAIPGVLYCGGSDTPAGTGTAGSGPATGAGGRPSTGSSTTTFATGSGGQGQGPATTGAGGDLTTSGPGGSAGAGGGATGPGAGGRAAGGAGGAGGVGGRGAGGAVVDAGACPRIEPVTGTACTSAMEVCDYAGPPAVACTCEAGMTRDGGMRDAWNCVRVRADAGAADASTCPRLPPGNRTVCPTVGEVCPYGAETCTCEMGVMGGADRWACGRTGADAAAD